MGRSTHLHLAWAAVSSIKFWDLVVQAVHKATAAAGYVRQIHSPRKTWPYGKCLNQAG